MTLVVDASVALRWLFPSAERDLDHLVKSERPIIAPDLILPEMTNAAWKFVRFDGLSVAAAEAAIMESANAFDEIVPSIEIKDRALAIAIELGHPAYDCFYLALAEQRDCQMATADERLVSRCARTPFAKRLKSFAGGPSSRR
jgi:predicted nucleic acid-binding protein